MRWLVHAARERSGHGMHNHLAAELLDAYNNQVGFSLGVLEWQLTGLPEHGLAGLAGLRLWDTTTCMYCAFPYNTSNLDI